MVIFANNVIDKITNNLIDIFSKKLQHYLEESPNSLGNLEKKLSFHLNEVCNWSKRIQFYGLGKAKEVINDTIKLEMLDTTRKFRNIHKSYNRYDEQELLNDQQNYLLLGDPGSGKTTTLKRLASEIILNQKETYLYRYPLLIRLRDFKEKDVLHKYISDILGINYQIVYEKDEKNQIIDTKTYIEQELIEIAIPRILNKTNAILLIDGLDEVSPYSFQLKIENEIVDLARKLKTSKIILTSRSGTHNKPLDGFNVFEICGLTTKQQKNITHIWLEDKDSEEFLYRLEKRSYNDLADRPLFLCQLLFLFSHHNYLPKDSSTIYDKTVLMFLEDWDNERRIKRLSKYSSFEPKMKLKFLSELSYRLTYKIKTKKFSEGDLMSCYNDMCESFDLPCEEAMQVAQELETHTGIIVSSIGDNFEFSHLSIQEYLCAEYISRDSFSTNIKSYITEYPAPLAVAVNLSSNPTSWFANLILNNKNWKSFNGNSLNILLTRMFVENPKFKTDEELGFAVIKLFFNFYKVGSYQLNNNLGKLLNIDHVKKSLVLAIRNYVVDTESDKSQYYHFIPNFILENKEFSVDFEKVLPSKGSFPKKHFDPIFEEFNIKFMLKKLGKDCVYYLLDGNEHDRLNPHAVDFMD